MDRHGYPPRLRSPGTAPAISFILLLALGELIMSCSTLGARGDTRHLGFSGYDWTVVDGNEAIGPGPNRFASANVSLDQAGRLVLKTGEDDSGWSCAEVFLDKSLSYGSYEIELLPIIDGLDARTVFGFYTWDESPEFAHREIDMELARWGDGSYPNLNFSVQPSEGHPERSAVAEIDLRAPLILRFEWAPTSIHFVALSGRRRVEWSFPLPSSSDTISSIASTDAGGEPAARPPFLVPPDGDEAVSLNLWIFRGDPADRPARIVVSRFSFTPLSD